ncbi:MAG: NAD-dependent epimerase/dehydratase family protein [Bacteroidetes bacterium]|nr:NAD-dependent epimerase/dehydratase family protein [Bacteroidota bacterium]
MKHTILGAGGSIGNPLAHKLLESGQDVRLVSRSGFTMPGAESVKADITSYQETLESIRQSDIVQLCAGLSYETKVWQEMWPKIMRNTIDACKSVGAKLIFFDNVYMYGRVDGKMTETTPYNPCSKKGEIRAGIARMLEDEMEKKSIQAIIARAADLYGPYATKTSVLFIMVIDKLMKGKGAQWMVNAGLPHSYTYTMDCANAMVLLANSNDAFNQVWHMPTHAPAIDGKTFTELVAKELGVPAKYSVLPKFMVKLVGLVDKTVSEIYEMLYQVEYEYHFDSSKFDTHFNYHPRSYEDGIKETIDFLKK